MRFKDRKNASYHAASFCTLFVKQTPVDFTYSGVDEFEMWTMGWEL
jgi:hypothetical protein